MINLEEILQEACTAEASQTTYLLNTDGDLNRSKLNDIIQVVNAALDDIHKRFVVSNNTIKLVTRPELRDYVLDVSNNLSINSDGYIDDTDPSYGLNAPVIAVLGLRTSAGIELRFNQRDKVHHNRNLAPKGLHTLGSSERGNFNFLNPKYNVIRCPNNLGVSTLFVDVRVSHPRLPLIPEAELDTYDLSEIIIELPYIYRTAIVYYLMARMFNSKGAMTVGRSIFHEGNNYYDKYIRECESIKASDGEVHEENDGLYKMQMKGFI